MTGIESRLDDLERRMNPQGEGGFEVVLCDLDWTPDERERHTAEAQARVGDKGVVFTIALDPLWSQL